MGDGEATAAESVEALRIRGGVPGAKLGAETLEALESNDGTEEEIECLGVGCEG